MPLPRSAALLFLALLPGAAPHAAAQRYSGLSSPPTAPPLGQTHTLRSPGTTAPPPVAPVSNGLGAMQFYPVNASVAAPQSLTRQLTSDDERTRIAAITALGAPAQYTQHGHVPVPHSIQLEIVPLSSSDDQDALLTAEFDHHIVTAVLLPASGEWRRVATVVFPTAFADPSTMPSTFLSTRRSLLEPGRYRAVFHARESHSSDDYTENEAGLSIFNGRAMITDSFVSEAHQCSTAQEASGCTLTRRWLQPDASHAGARRFLLVTASGSLSSKDMSSALSDAHDFHMAHLRSYSCQPFTFSDSNLRFEPIGPSGPCPKLPPHQVYR